MDWVTILPTQYDHCESWEGLWLQGWAALQKHGFRDAEPHPVSPPNAKKNHGIFEKQLRPDITSSLLNTHLCLLSTVWQWSVICYYRICQLDLEIGQNIPCFVFSLPGCVALHHNELWKHVADEAAADWSQGSHSVTPIKQGFRLY